MPAAISVLGGIGLFLLGVPTMTDGQKGLAASSLRAVQGGPPRRPRAPSPI